MNAQQTQEFQSFLLVLAAAMRAARMLSEDPAFADKHLDRTADVIDLLGRAAAGDPTIEIGEERLEVATLQ
jgi:hypothetical protein